MSSAKLPPDALVGTLLLKDDERYRLLAVIASGELAHVYRARDESRRTGDEIAIKLLRPELASPAAHQRFACEAEATRRSQHPNVVKLLSKLHRDAGLSFFCCELLVGIDLAQLLHAQRTLDPRRAVRLVRGIAEGLIGAHAAGVVHRDIKPENVFVVHHPDGREFPKLLDFGSAFVQGEFGGGEGPPEACWVQPAGTPGYIPPEQLAGADPAPSADVYGLGALLFELLTGRRHRQIVEEKQVVAGVPGACSLSELRGLSVALEAALQKALAASSIHRFQQMSAFRDALLRVPEA